MRKTLFSNVWVVAFLAMTPLSAFAQTSQPQAPTAPEKKVQSTDDVGSLRREGIDVVQNRVFIKGNRSEVSLGGGFIFDDPFLRYQTAELRYTYHFNEGIAIEGSYLRAFHQNKPIINDLANIPCPNATVDAALGGNCGVTLDPSPDPYKNIFMGNFVWSPIYGKFSIFSRKILHFDIFATAGAGYFMDERDNHFGINVGVGTKVFVNDWSAVRIDFRNFTVREGAPFNHILNSRIISIGYSFFFPSHVEREQ